MIRGYCPACFALLDIDPDGTIADHDHPDRGWAEIGCPGSGHMPLSQADQRRIAEHFNEPTMFQPRLSLVPAGKGGSAS